MSKIYIDITAPLASGMPQWPGDPVLESWLVSALASGDEADVTALRLSAHTGTHVDAPSHYLAGAAAVDRLPLDALIGPAEVIEVAGPMVTAADVAKATLPRVLFRTANSAREWWRLPFRADAVALDESAAQQLVEKRIAAAGIDYLSIGNAQVHRILLGAGIVVIEGLCLNSVRPGEYGLICLPLKLEAADGAPARVLIHR